MSAQNLSAPARGVSLKPALLIRTIRRGAVGLSLIIALLTFGEGWHNNHHAHQTSARHGLTWYEFDISWITLKMLRAVGLVWGIRTAKVDTQILQKAA